MALSVNIEKQLGNFSLKVCFEAESEILALLGASGCGKSMTLKCIAGIEKPDRGRIVLDDFVLFDSEKHINLPPQKRKVGYLFQQYALFPNMTVRQNILCGVRDRKNAESALRQIISAMHLEGMEQKRPHQLSGGQQQRVALARILVNEPEVLMLDEPFSALDSHLRFQLEREVQAILKDYGKTVLLVSHDRDEVFRLSERIAVMHNGKVDAYGTKHEVFANPRTSNGARLTGCKNISAAVKLDESQLSALDWGIKLHVPAVPEGIDHVGIRLHDVCLGGGENSFFCRVVSVIENPFSYTVMLQPEENTDTEPIGIELDKSIWEQNSADSLLVNLPPEKILCLKG